MLQEREKKKWRQSVEKRLIKYPKVNPFHIEFTTSLPRDIFSKEKEKSFRKKRREVIYDFTEISRKSKIGEDNGNKGGGRKGYRVERRGQNFVD